MVQAAQAGGLAGQAPGVPHAGYQHQGQGLEDRWRPPLEEERHSVAAIRGDLRVIGGGPDSYALVSTMQVERCSALL